MPISSPAWTGSQARTSSPLPGSLLRCSRPRNASTRSRRPTRPSPVRLACRSIPRPSSSTTTSTSAPRRSSDTVRCAASACLATLVRHSCTRRYTVMFMTSPRPDRSPLADKAAIHRTVAPLPLPHQMRDRIVQPERIQRRRPQPLHDTPHDLVDVPRQLDDGGGAGFDFGLQPVAHVADGYRVQLDGVEALAQLVVQLARQAAPLVLLHHQVLLRQQAVLRQAARPASCCDGDPQAQLVLGVPPAPPGEPGERQGERPEGQRQLVDLVALERMGDLGEPLAQLQPRREREGPQRDGEPPPAGRSATRWPSAGGSAAWDRAMEGCMEWACRAGAARWRACAASWRGPGERSKGVSPDP